MDPEAGGGGGPGLPGAGFEVVEVRDAEGNIVQRVLRAIIEPIRRALGAVAEKQGRSVGADNRFFFDEATQTWKLEGETEQDRAELEQLRFHTSRGLTTCAAPATTACDATRGSFASMAGGVPPPPPAVAGAAPMQGYYAKSGNVNDADATAALDRAMTHPVYAPQGLALGPPPAGSAAAGGAAPAPAGRPEQAPVQALSSPFGARPAAPMPPQARTSPFGAAPAASAAPVTSPFGVVPPVQEVVASGVAEA